MILSKDQVKKIIEGAPQGTDPNEVVKGLLSRGYQLEGLNDNQSQQQPEHKGFIRTVAEGIATPFAKVGVQGANVFESTVKLLAGDTQGASEALDKSRNIPGLGKVAPVISGTQAQNESFGTQVKKVVGTGLDIGSNFIGAEGASAVVKQGLKGLVKQGAITGLKYGASTGGISSLGQAMEEDKGLIETGLRTVVGTVGGAVLGSTLGAATPAVKAGMNKLLLPVEQKISNVLRESIDKGIKPYFGNKATPALRDAYYKKAEDAFAIIHKYKPALLDDTVGEEVVRSPQSRREMLEALGKSKKSIYEKYSSLAQESGEAGAQFDANAIVDELAKVSKDLKKPPQIRRYAEEMFDEIAELDGQSPEIIEARIQDLNQSLAGYYEGRTTKAKAQLDASVANLMRTKLDEIIEKSTGKQYQVLKNEYGALKAVEKDLTRQVALEARKNVKGLADMTDIFTGGDILSGVITGNPALLARGVAGKGIKEYIQYLNNPNRYIKKAFDILDNPPADIKAEIEKAVEYANTHAGLSVQDVSKSFKAAKQALKTRIDAELPKVQALVNTGATTMDDYAFVKKVSDKFQTDGVVTVEEINKVNRLLNSLKDSFKAYDKYGVNKSIPLNGRRAYVNGKTILKPLSKAQEAENLKTMTMEELKNKMKESGPYSSAFEAAQNRYRKEIYRRMDQAKKAAKVTKTSNNLYHTTPAENINSIRKNGLTVGNKPRYAGVSSKNKISFSANEEAASYYGGKNDVMLRTKTSYKPQDLSEDLLAGGEGVYVTGKNIPPEMLEIKINGKWRSLLEQNK